MLILEMRTPGFSFNMLSIMNWYGSFGILDLFLSKGNSPGFFLIQKKLSRFLLSEGYFQGFFLNQRTLSRIFLTQRYSMIHSDPKGTLQDIFWSKGSSLGIFWSKDTQEFFLIQRTRSRTFSDPKNPLWDFSWTKGSSLGYFSNGRSFPTFYSFYSF